MEIQNTHTNPFAAEAATPASAASRPVEPVPEPQAPEPVEPPRLNVPPPSQLSFRVDESVGRVVVSIIDGETGEVVRQIPNNEALAIMRRVRESLEHLVDEVI